MDGKLQDKEPQNRRERLNCMKKKHNEHNVFAMSCELNSPDITSARRSSCPIIRSPGFVPIVSNAQSVFATFCELNSPDIVSARRSSANRRGPVALYLCFAMICRVLKISWAPKSCMFCRADSSSVCNACASAFGGTPRCFFRTWRKAVATFRHGLRVDDVGCG